MRASAHIRVVQLQAAHPCVSAARTCFLSAELFQSKSQTVTIYSSVFQHQGFLLNSLIAPQKEQQFLSVL